MNQKKIPHIKIEKAFAQKFIDSIKKFPKSSILNKKYKTFEIQDMILFPLKENILRDPKFLNFVENNPEFKIAYYKGNINPNYKPQSLEEALGEMIPQKYYDLIPNSYDIIGSIAIIEFPPLNILIDGSEIKEKIANAIILVNKNVKSVYEKKSKIKGSYRLRELNHLVGKKQTETIHKENNCSFKLDVKKTFFSPRLIQERKRLASIEYNRKEILIDLFAGVGTISIQIAKFNDILIHAFDKNPIAVQYLKKNIKTNKIKGEIIAHHEDVKDLLNPRNKIGKTLHNKANRVIMNLPQYSITFVNVACFLLKESGGIIHNYQFCEKPDSRKKAIKNLQNALRSYKWDLKKVINAKIVKSYSPSSNMIVLDVSCKKTL